MVTGVPFSKIVSVPGTLYGFEHLRINIGIGGYLRRVSEKVLMIYSPSLRSESDNFLYLPYSVLNYLIQTVLYIT